MNIKSTSYLFVLLSCLAIFSDCGDNTFKEFEPPHIELIKHPDEPDSVTSDHIVDSLKNSLKGSILDKTLAFDLVVRDPAKSGVKEIKYKLEGGAGELLYQGESVISTITGVVADTKIRLKFRPLANGIVMKLVFSVVNNVNVEGKPSTVEVVLFDNIPPIAIFEIKEGNDGSFSRLLDASKSYDQDARYGGKIRTLEYSITRKGEDLGLVRGYDTTSFTTPVVFPGVGSYVIRCRVYDDEGAASPVAIKPLEINE